MDKIVVVSGCNDIVKIPKKSKKKSKKEQKRAKKSENITKRCIKVGFLNYSNLNKELILLFFLIIRLTYNNL